MDAADVEEIPADGETPLAYALRVARAKALAAQSKNSSLPALAADTDVVLHGRILGKPRDAQDATRMLAMLSGRSHEVISAVVLVSGARLEQINTTTAIDFAALNAGDIARYVASGEPMGKAGAYAIQGGAARFVRAVRGSYTGVVGLPLAETCELLARFGVFPEG